MDLAVTCGLRVSASTGAARRVVRHVLGDLPPAMAGDAVATVVVDAGSSVDIDAEGRVTIGAARGPELLWAACAAAALHAGRLPLHGATLTTLDGRRVTVVGGSGSGKTTAVLAARATGAAVVAPEWVLVDADGTVAPLPGRLRLRPHHMTGLAGWTDPLPPRARLRSVAGSLLEPVARRNGRARAAVEHRTTIDVRLPLPVARLDPLDIILVLESAPGGEPAVSDLSAASAPKIADLLRDDLRTLRQSGAMRPDATARLDDLTGPSLDVLVAERLTVGPPRTLGIRHHHPHSGQQFVEAVQAALR